MTESTRYQANPAVSCGDEEDGAVLYNPDTDDTTIVNLPGRALWAFMETPRTVDEMAAYLTETYRDVAAEQAAEDAAQFIQALLPNFVLEANDDA
ncbi:MAG: PqqD family peptide modification chaperone [Chloroflexi bacterium]|nr:PqqD family peptide modification chaperone [Chloroflexota bacterium]MBU1750148.1 PqqD family peptide modification chaperone [Chloroflexota bacterium]